MHGEQISAIIHTLCRKHGIDYESKNPHYASISEDAMRLGEIYQELKIILGDLLEIEERHGLNSEAVIVLNKVISEIDDADHSIIKVAKELLAHREG